MGPPRTSFILRTRFGAPPSSPYDHFIPSPRIAAPLAVRVVRRYGWIILGLAALAAVQAAPIGAPAFSAAFGVDATSIAWVVPQY